MATTGSVDVNLTAIGNTINNSTTLGHLVVQGVADQGDLIGLAIGLAIAIGLLIGLIFLVISIIPRLIAKVKGIRRA